MGNTMETASSKSPHMQITQLLLDHFKATEIRDISLTKWGICSVNSPSYPILQQLINSRIITIVYLDSICSDSVNSWPTPHIQHFFPQVSRSSSLTISPSRPTIIGTGQYLASGIIRNSEVQIINLIDAGL